MFLQLALAYLIISTAGALDCTEAGDGNHETACKTYVTCSNGVATTHECLGTQVYNSDIEACDDISNVGPPCGFPARDCTDKPDEKYPETTNCTWYYTCKDGVDIGHNYCPGSLVFNYDLQLCDWPSSVCPPCGTKSTGCTTLFVG